MMQVITIDRDRCYHDLSVGAPGLGKWTPANKVNPTRLFPQYREASILPRTFTSLEQDTAAENRRDSPAHLMDLNPCRIGVIQRASWCYRC